MLMQNVNEECVVRTIFVSRFLLCSTRFVVMRLVNATFQKFAMGIRRCAPMIHSKLMERVVVLLLTASVALKEIVGCSLNAVFLSPVLVTTQVVNVPLTMISPDVVMTSDNVFLMMVAAAALVIPSAAAWMWMQNAKEVIVVITFSAK